jgi:hypothetical protein
MLPEATPLIVPIGDDDSVLSRQTARVRVPVRAIRAGAAAAWMDAYWRLVCSLTLGLVHVQPDGEGFSLVVIGTNIKLFQFGKPSLYESDNLVYWAVSLKAGLVQGGTGGVFYALARRSAPEQWELSMTLRDFVPRLAILRPRSFWRRFYQLTQGVVHHVAGIVYLNTWH